MNPNIQLSFPQLLDLVRSLPADQKIQLSKELEREGIQSKLTELLTAFRTDAITMDEITKEVEEARQHIYDRQKTS